MIRNGFITDPDSRLLPVYRISPFDNSAALVNRNLRPTGAFRKWFNAQHPGYHWAFTLNGRDAIRYALESLQLEEDDLVTILTTTGNFYISGCVTQQIAQFCKWNREISPSTKVIFINHEFGIPYENLSKLKEYRLPLIEDCAHAFLSQNAEKSVGTTGDFLVFSLPKYFPVQIGGIICSANPIMPGLLSLSDEEHNYIEAVLDANIEKVDIFAKARRLNYNSLAQKFSSLGKLPRFELQPYHIPGVFMFRIDPEQNPQALKEHLQKNGIESSVFYTESAVFLPVHHSLSENDLDYIFEITKSYFER
jgi:dTDP-4-amino-4,6-dideoxygalactose transaminase